MTESGDPKPEKPRDPYRRPEGGLAGAWQFLRGMPDRLRRPESLLMLLALLASIGAHMPPYVGLGALADYFETHEKKPAELPPSEVTFEVAAPSEPEVVPPPEPEKEPEEKKRAEREKPKPKPEEQKREEPKPEAPPKPELKLAVEPPRPQLQPPPPPPPEERKQSITQKSDDPNVEPPPDAKYLAEESRVVEEETVAKVTSETKNDPDPQAAAPEAPGPEKSGDSREQERGAEEGADVPEQVASVAQAAQPPPQPQVPQQPQQKPAVPKQSAVEATPQQPTIIRDPMGTFVLAPSAPPRDAKRARDGRQGTSAPAQQPNLKVSWSAFEQTFGREQLAQDRMPKEAKRLGAGREKRWTEFRAAIENYVAGIKPGNTTALNAAADPFAAYLAAFHRNLHMEFVHEFINSLPMAGALADPELVTKVEIVVNPDGTLDRVGVVKSSGNLMYDFGAFNAVQRGAPYPPTPEKIRSPDGRTYIKWALHRNESQCGTWNAEPYILKSAPRSPNDPTPDSVSPYMPGNSGAEQGRAPKEEPKGKGNGKPGSAPVVVPGETLGARELRRRHQLASLLLPNRG